MKSINEARTAIAARLPHPRSGNRIPSLDGWRAVAVAMVLLSHGAFTTAQANPTLVYVGEHTPFRGDIGVNIFFVLSGFLITRLLLAEESRMGKIDLGAFFLRRSLRIWPVYFTCLAVIALLNFAGHWGLGWRHFGPSLTFTTGSWARKESIWITAHFWSLAVEQQFYVLWPLFLLATRSGARAPIVLGLLVFLPVLRMALAFWYSFPLGMPIVSHIDFLLWGAVFAMGWNRHLLPMLTSMRRPSLLLLGALAVAFGGFALVEYVPRWVSNGHLVGALAYGPAPLLLASGMATAIAVTIAQPGLPLARVLNSRAFVFVGTISYSVYVWQQLVLNPMVPIVHVWQKFPCNALLALLIGTASYFGYERWFLKLKARFTPPRDKSVATPESTAKLVPGVAASS